MECQTLQPPPKLIARPSYRSTNWFEQSNFAGLLVRRLGPDSYLIDAATGQTVEPSELPGLIVGCAVRFVAAGLRPGDRVILGCGLNPASAIAYLGSIYAGLVPVMLENRTLIEGGERVRDCTQARAVWTSEPCQLKWAEDLKMPRLHGAFDACPANSMPAAPRGRSDLAALMPTSGSTGAPRLVAVTHGNLLSNTEAIARSQRLGSGERAMLILPVSYCFGASVLHTHLYQGGGVVFDSRFMFADKVLRAMNTYNCTTFAGVPTAYNILLRRSSLGSIALPGLRRFLQAGGSLPPENVRKMQDYFPAAQFYVMYGQTEATARISCLPPSRLHDKLGSVGLPLDNLTVRIVNDAGEECATDEIGEIWVSGPSVTDGYYGEPEQTALKFCDGWLKTGDMGMFDADGFLWLKERRGEFIKIRGVRVSFGEVESKVATVPGVFECAAASVPHPEAGEQLALYVVPENGVNDLPAKIHQTLPPPWDCGAIYVVEELPRTTNGKLARSRLAEQRVPEPGELEERINGLLKAPPYMIDPEQRKTTLLALFKDQIARACQQNERFANYVAHWPTPYRAAARIADLPYLPVNVFKSEPPLALVDASEITRTLSSSATTGQKPSRVVLDSITARRMSKGVMAIVKEFIGPARRPYLVIDTTENLAGRPEMGARGAAVQGLRSFARETICCLRPGTGGQPELDVEKLIDCASEWKDADVLAYGFTYMIWNSLVLPLQARGLRLNLPNVHILHSGGWKRLEHQAVSREDFARGAASVFGCAPERVIDFYGLVENVGVVYPSCSHGNKHVPAFAEVIVRDPLSLEPVSPGQQGLLQVCSVLPTSFPGFLILTEDIAELIAHDGCPCGRRGVCFRFVGRVPKAETRGCGNVEPNNGHRG